MSAVINCYIYRNGPLLFFMPTQDGNVIGNRDGKSSQKNILKDWSDGKLKLLWQHETGKGYGIGSVADGKFYHFDLYGKQTRLTCLDCTSGIADWTFKYESNYDDLYGYDAGPRATPIIDGDHVYTYGVEGQLHCLDKSDGQVVWKKDLNKQFGVIQNYFWSRQFAYDF